MRRSIRPAAKPAMEGLAITLLLFCLLSIHKISNARDTITAAQFMTDGDTIVSSGGSFEMGFFSPGNSTNRYVGMWYKNIPNRTVVWVANREVPLNNTSGVLKVMKPGILILVNSTNNSIWSSNTSRSARSPVAQLLDSGNLVVREAEDDRPDNFLWQSFDYPTDTVLPGMKLGKNFVTGQERYLSSWKSNDDPAPGDFTYGCDPSGYPQVTLKKGSREVFRSGPWNGLRFSGTPYSRPNSVYTYQLVFNEQEVYYSYDLLNRSIVSRLRLNENGFAQRSTWIDQTKEWLVYVNLPTDDCDTYSLCGTYGSCNVGNFPICSCMDKFLPKNPEEWSLANWSNGCLRRTPMDCQNQDGFLQFAGIKLPDTRYSWFNESMTLKECEMACSKNCSCMAYAQLDIRLGGSGCLLWFGDLIDIKQFSGGGQDIYVRMASSELVSSSNKKKKGKTIKVILSVPVGLGVVVLLGLILTFYVWRKKKNQHLKNEGRRGHETEQDYADEGQEEDLELPLFGLSTIVNATNNFSPENKLGEGGFGPVYKGVLEEGQEIAVKRLSKTSMQGLNEFKNEVMCIAKLQHRNLVKLLGCCIQGAETMLIYEYMPNKSLDYFIFDETRSTLLDWPKRFHIINGIARGLLYLHQDSRLRIIHRDLKTSNVLLDFDMNPKISDFGMAKSFGGNETEGNTNRVVGTYGYMSPEYTIDGLFSVKSDVFSFGVLVLEIVSGKRNRKFIHQDHQHNLLGHAWRLYNEGRSRELIDANLRDLRFSSEVLKSIHVGLLCVQKCPEDRPSMSSVVLMLSSDGGLSQPKQPGFFTERSVAEDEYSSSTNAPSASNKISFTLLDGR